MTEIFAHRALCGSKENSIKGITNCIKLGIGIELDIRGKTDTTYISHDPTNDGELFDAACKILENSNSKIALHIKEIDALEEVVKIITKHSINKNCFIFADSINYDIIDNLVGETVEVAFYANKKPSNVNAKILWCDELKAKWYEKNFIKELHKENKVMYAMSKELLEPCNNEDIITDWKRLLELQFDGICTDYPRELYQFSIQHKEMS